jgi:hypothetical protein
MCAKSEHLGYVQQRVARGEYRVNSTRVAAAILQRIGAIALDREVSGVLDREVSGVGDRDRGPVSLVRPVA